MSEFKIVVADDDASQVALLERLLTSAGHTVLTCDNGATALELVQQHAPVLLIADWEMPGLTGLELCRKIRASRSSDGTYILLLTGNDEQTQIVAGLEAGADDYLVKTRSHTELLARVRAGARLLKAHTTTGPPRTFSTKLLTAVALATLGIFALAGWNLWSTQRATVRTLSESLRIHELCGKIVHLDEVLTMSARLAVATSDLRWEDRYRSFEPELDDAIKEASELAQSSFEGEGAAQTDAANIKLVEMENRAFDLVRQGQHEAAGDMLFSEEYEEQKRVYAAGMQAVFFSMRKWVEDQVSSDRTRMSVAGWVAAAALTVMASVCFGMLLVVGRHIRERSRAEGALQEAYGELEARVKQRTADLRCANEQLLAEIAQRELAEKEREKHVHDLGERVKELTCMYGVAKAIRERGSLEHVFRDVAMLIPPGWHYPEITRGRTCFDGKEFVSEPFEEGEWRQTSDIVVSGEPRGSVEVHCLEQRPELDEEPFMKEKSSLINGIAHALSEAIEYKQAEEQVEQANAQLLQSAKMVSIGQLAAGVAHEINNPIGFISSNLHSLGEYVIDLKRALAAYDELLSECGQGDSDLERKAAEVSKVRDDCDLDFIVSDLDNLLSESVEGTKRVRKIVGDLRDFSHVDSGEVNEEDINELLDKTINVAWNELKYKTEVVREYGQIPAIPCYGGKLGQVFLNLLVNAAQAIEERGTITVRTGEDDSHVWAEVEDTGSGMPPDVMDRIFDPFFTTKEVGKGTGMGLHLAYNIIDAHGGSIECKSTVGQGTTFRIELPIKGPPEVHIEPAESSV